jgi:nitrogen fixation protein FixH
MKKGWYWPFLLVGLLAAGVAANLYFLARAVGDPSFAVEPDYYAKALAWDAHQAQARENVELGWSVTLDVTPADLATGRARVVAKLTDRDGRSVPGAAVALTAFHNARAANVLTATLSETAEHDYAADVPIVRAGLWEFRVAATRGSETFTAVVDQDAPGALR